MITDAEAIINENWGMKHVRKSIALKTNSRNIEFYSKYLNLPVWENYEPDCNESFTILKNKGRHDNSSVLHNFFARILHTIVDVVINLDTFDPEKIEAFYFDPEHNHPKHQEINEEIVRFTRKSGNKTSYFANFEMDLGVRDGVKTNFYKNDAGVGLIEFCFDDGTHLYVFH